MSTFIRKHGTFANVVSVLALSVALGGTSYAAAQLPKNSVGSKQIKPAGVKASDVHADAIGSGSVANGSLTGADLAAGSVSSSTVANGSLKAEDLASGVLGKLPNVTVQYEIAAAGLAEGTSASFDVLCPAGQVAVGGGARGDTTDSEYTKVTSSRPLMTGGGFPTDNQSFNGWRATVFRGVGSPGGGFPASPPDGPILPEVWAICLSSP